MTDLIKNGNFNTDLTDWTLSGNGTQAWYAARAYSVGGALLIQAPAQGACYVTQEFTTPAASEDWRLALSVLPEENCETDADLDDWLSAWITVTGGLDKAVYEVLKTLSARDATVGELVWHRFMFDCKLPPSTLCTLTIQAYALAKPFYIDAVSLVSLPPDSGSCEDLVWQLCGLRNDRAMAKHPWARYQSVIDQAIREAPPVVWPTETDTSLTTVDEQRRYTLVGVTDLLKRDQLRALWVEDDGDGHYYERGRYHVEDSAGVLTLVLHEDPDDADLTMKLEYYAEPAALDCTDPSDVTTLDRDWILARAMTLLLLEANPQIEDPAWLMAELNSWDMKRQAREGQLRPHYRSKRKALTRKWS